MKLGLKYQTFLAAIILAGAGLVAATLPFGGNSGKFNVICKIKGHTVVVEGGDRDPVPGRLGPAEWSATVEYSIDPKRMTYRTIGQKGQPANRIQAITADSIQFTHSKNEIEQISLPGNTYYSWSKGEGYLDEVQEGDCIRSAFSQE
jgi:hypothetical protein